MSAVLVARFENKGDADFVAELIKRFLKNTLIFKGKNWEDFYLGEMIEEGMKDEGEISGMEFSAYLEKKIKAVK